MTQQLCVNTKFGLIFLEKCQKLYVKKAIRFLKVTVLFCQGLNFINAHRIGDKASKSFVSFVAKLLQFRYPFPKNCGALNFKWQMNFSRLKLKQRVQKKKVG